MDFKDYYAALGVARGASQDEIKRAYRKLARKYHPDVSKEADAEAKFKDVAEAHEALIDPERRAAYDALAERHARGQAYEPPPGWSRDFDDGTAQGGTGTMGGEDFSDFFESLFGRGAARSSGGRRPRAAEPGGDIHAKVVIDLQDSYRGARRTVTLHLPREGHPGQSAPKQLEVNIPAGVREGQHLRLAGQGAPGFGGGPAGDLFLEIALAPHPHFRVDGRDVYADLPVAPWEAALGASVSVALPDGEVQLGVPPGSTQGRKLRLKGKGLPGKTPGDFYAVIGIAMPPAIDPLPAAAQEAWAALARAYPNHAPRAATEG